MSSSLLTILEKLGINYMYQKMPLIYWQNEIKTFLKNNNKCKQLLREAFYWNGL